MSASSEKVFWIRVVNDKGAGLDGVWVTVVQFDEVGPYASGSPVLRGLTSSGGWFGIKCNYSYKAEVFLDNKSYGFYWCENGVSVSIKK